MGKEVGGEFGMGGTRVHLWLLQVDAWQKPPQYCKGISLQLNKLIFKKWMEILFLFFFTVHFKLKYS